MTALMKTICAALLASAAMAASAQEANQDASPVYVGASWGAHTSYSLDCYRIDGCSNDANTSGKLYAGYTLGTRAGFGDHKVTDSIELSTFWINGAYKRGIYSPFQQREKTKGVAVTWATKMDLGSGFGMNSRLGLSYARTRLESRGGGYPETHSNDQDLLGATVGIGLSYALNRNWSLHTDYDYIPVKTTSSNGNGHVNMWSVGAAYHF